MKAQKVRILELLRCQVCYCYDNHTNILEIQNGVKKREKISAISTLVAVFSHSAPNKTNNETDNNYKVQALVTKQTKKKKVKNEI